MYTTQVGGAVAVAGEGGNRPGTPPRAADLGGARRPREPGGPPVQVEGGAGDPQLRVDVAGGEQQDRDPSRA